MKMIPYERLILRSPLRPVDALKRLEENIQPKQAYLWPRTGQKPYQGKIEGSNFNVRRIISYRNSFLPMIDGVIQPEMGGSSIAIRMHPHIAVTVFMGLWFAAFTLFFLYSLVGILFSPSNSAFQQPVWQEIDFLPLGMIIFGYVLTLASFKFESNKSKNFFRELFQATEMNESGITDLFQVQ